MAAAAAIGLCRFELNRAAPAQSCAVPEPAAMVAEIPVRPLTNPAKAPVNLRIAFQATSSPPPRTIAVSLFPVDEPQTFAIRIPRPARCITVSLIPGPKPVTVEVGPIRWR